ncbi:hypothetical protein EV580_2751 [Mycobacterium sp. BK086]|nr:hypothetical protein EV580_2751 [Mycobacterium sp. BK086]
MGLYVLSTISSGRLNSKELRHSACQVQPGALLTSTERCHARIGGVEGDQFQN